MYTYTFKVVMKTKTPESKTGLKIWTDDCLRGLKTSWRSVKVINIKDNNK